MQQNENIFAFTKTNSKYIESNIDDQFIDELIYHVRNNQSNCAYSTIAYTMF